MIRRVIHIDEEKCDGCGICVNACHEGAIGIVGGKAKLLRDDYCDGLGDCLPACPAHAITFVEREAAAYDEEAVRKNLEARNAAGHAAPAAQRETPTEKREASPMDASTHHHDHAGCPGARARSLAPAAEDAARTHTAHAPNVPSQLKNWPIQIKLAPAQAPYFDGANLLVAADCCAFSYGNFHAEFMRGKVTLIGCPKLDATDYGEKLAEIIRSNDVRSVTIARMEVPCCGGLEQMTKNALMASGKFIPWQVATFSLDGRLLD